MKTRAIYVQGCARSGNTLMRELCVAAFENAELVKISEKSAECDLQHLIDSLESSDGRLLVASRNRTTSVYMDLEQLRSHPEIAVVWMLRNPLDVLTSKRRKARNFYVHPYRVTASLNLYNQFRDEPQVLSVRYEDLVARPSEVQRQITERFDLQVSRPFADCHEHFPGFRQNLEALKSIRPIDAKSVEKWKTNPEYAAYLAEVLRTNQELPTLARLCGGYEINRETLLQFSKGSANPLRKLQLVFGKRG